MFDVPEQVGKAVNVAICRESDWNRGQACTVGGGLTTNIDVREINATCFGIRPEKLLKLGGG
jgi:hypothetical protein